MRDKLINYKNRYEELVKENFSRMNLDKDELVRHCVDDELKKYYHIEWAVTNKGRIWSLYQNNWLNPRNQKGYWRVANTYVHDLVDYYFMTDEEKRIKQIAEKYNKEFKNSKKIKLQVHHLDAVKVMDSSIMTKEERVNACKDINKKSNLMLQMDIDHYDDHKINDGKQTKGEGNGTEAFDVMTAVIRNSNPEAYYTYGENGKRQINMTLKLKGMTPEEEKEFEKQWTEKHKEGEKIYYIGC